MEAKGFPSVEHRCCKFKLYGICNRADFLAPEVCDLIGIPAWPLLVRFKIHYDLCEVAATRSPEGWPSASGSIYADRLQDMFQDRLTVRGTHRSFYFANGFVTRGGNSSRCCFGVFDIDTFRHGEGDIDPVSLNCREELKNHTAADDQGNRRDQDK